jgi:predicted ribosome quality control (RQC) complex YloA/Tae2 family protein
MKIEVMNFKNTEYEIFIGRNKKENWDLIDASNETDIWFHVANVPSCHIFLKTEEPISKIPRQVIKRCACLCKSYSSSASIKNCEIIYTTIANIKKGEHVGEVITQNTKKILI